MGGEFSWAAELGTAQLRCSGTRCETGAALATVNGRCRRSFISLLARAVWVGRRTGGNLVHPCRGAPVESVSQETGRGRRHECPRGDGQGILS